nr:ribonuclease H-like domain-containing protein [Tanacetum cinerariifolium]
MMAASKGPMFKPGEFEIWRMRIEQYIQMIDYALWEVIENGATLPKIQVVEDVMTKMPITFAEEKAQRRLEVKARSTLMMGIPNEHQLKFNSIKDAKKLLKAVEKRFVNTAHRVSTASTQVNAAYIDNLSDVVICSFFASQSNIPQLVHEDLEQIYLDDIDLRWQMAMWIMRARRSVPMETNNSTPLVLCDGLGGYDWSDQAEEVENCKAKEETMAVRKNDDAPIIEEWVSDDKEENVA